MTERHVHHFEQNFATVRCVSKLKATRPSPRHKGQGNKNKAHGPGSWTSRKKCPGQEDMSPMSLDGVGTFDAIPSFVDFDTCFPGIPASLTVLTRLL